MAHTKAQAAWAEVSQKPKGELLEATAAALDVLNLRDHRELKCLAKPPSGIDRVCISLLHLLAGICPAVELTRKGNVKQASWKGAQNLLASAGVLLQTMTSFKDLVDEGSVPGRNIERARRLKDEMGDDFSVHVMASKSGAAAGICAWVINIIAYYDIAAPLAPEPLRPSDSEPSSDKMRTVFGLDTPHKSSITELKCIRTPPEGVKAVCCACCLLLLRKEQEIDWKSNQRMLAQASFLSELLALDPHTISEETLDKVEALLL